MLFAYDTTTALAAAAALVNSARTDEDTISTVAELGDFLDTHEFSGRRDRTRAELGAVQDLRDRIALFWEMDRDEAAEEVNTILRATRALPYLSRHDGLDWHVHVTDTNDPLADRLAAEAAMAMADLIRADEFDRLGHCAGEDCSSVIVDLSRNRSRKFCVERNCGNRANVAAYRQRQADEAEDSDD